LTRSEESTVGVDRTVGSRARRGAACLDASRFEPDSDASRFASGDELCRRSSLGASSTDRTAVRTLHADRTDAVAREAESHDLFIPSYLHPAISNV
jgi:hypothetical protein